MGYVFGNDSYRTLQTSFDFQSPIFQVSGKNFENFRFGSWLIQEYIGSDDNRLRPGEAMLFSEYNKFNNSVDQSNIERYIYEGLVDLDGNGFLDSIVVSKLSQEVIITDLSLFIDFQPFSTSVTLNRVDFFVQPLIAPPPFPEDTVESEFNQVSGTKRNDDLRGTNGDDILLGKGGNDKLNGRSGNDLLVGDGGRDQLYGGTGNDDLWGGKGRDDLLGGSGEDAFWFDSGGGFDTVRDFSDEDILVFDRSDGYFAGVRKRDIQIKDKGSHDRLYVGDELVAKVYGEEVDGQDFILV